MHNAFYTMDMYTLNDLHLNSRGIVQVSPSEEFLDTESTLRMIEQHFTKCTTLEQRMLSFFKKQVEPELAYKDNDINQGKTGPRRLHVVGRLRRLDHEIGIFARLGISSPGENPLIPVLQVMYLQDRLHTKYFTGHRVGTEHDPDRWFYNFTERYNGMIKGMGIRTRVGMATLPLITSINEALLRSNGDYELDIPSLPSAD